MSEIAIKKFIKRDYFKFPMITENEINEIKSFIENSTNPVFLFDDDPDGVCAYLLLKKFYKKGKGIPIKGSPMITVKFLEIVEKNDPDLIIILDKPIVEQEFIDKSPCKIVWMDHHPLVKRNNVSYYNPRMHDEEDNRPTTYLAYSITKSNPWIAIIGCIFDFYVPDFSKELLKQYPDLISEVNGPDDIRFNTNFGKIIKIFAFNLKGESKYVKKSLSMLEEVESPYEILNQSSESGKYLYQRYEKLNKSYERLLEKAIKEINEDELFVFLYPSEKTSFTSELANEILYKNKNKIILIGREKFDKIIMSIRSDKKKIIKAVERALVGINGYGGGHDYACGGCVDRTDFERFIENLKREL